MNLKRDLSVLFSMICLASMNLSSYALDINKMVWKVECAPEVTTGPEFPISYTLEYPEEYEVGAVKFEFPNVDDGVEFFYGPSVNVFNTSKTVNNEPVIESKVVWSYYFKAKQPGSYQTPVPVLTYGEQTLYPVMEQVGFTATGDTIVSEIPSNLTVAPAAKAKFDPSVVSEVYTDAKIKYNGHVYSGLADIIAAIKDTTGKKGWVARDAKKYKSPTPGVFETRSYQNYYFGTSKEELARKKAALSMIDGGDTYVKLTDDTAEDLLPMIYYKGEGNRMLVRGLEVEP